MGEKLQTWHLLLIVFNNLVWLIISGQAKNVLCQGSFSILQTLFEILICLE